MRNQPTGAIGGRRIFHSLILRARFANDTIINGNNGIGTDHRHGRLQACPCRGSLCDRQPDDHICSRLIIVTRFIDIDNPV